MDVHLLRFFRLNKLLGTVPVRSLLEMIKDFNFVKFEISVVIDPLRFVPSRMIFSTPVKLPSLPGIVPPKPLNDKSIDLNASIPMRVRKKLSSTNELLYRKRLPIIFGTYQYFMLCICTVSLDDEKIS